MSRERKYILFILREGGRLYNAAHLLREVGLRRNVPHYNSVLHLLEMAERELQATLANLDEEEG